MPIIARKTVNSQTRYDARSDSPNCFRKTAKKHVEVIVHISLPISTSYPLQHRKQQN